MNNIASITRTVAVAVVLVLAATGIWASPAGEEEPAAAMEKEMVLDPATGKMVTAPEYGGTLTSLFHPGWESEHADMWHFRSVIHQVKLVVERMGGGNWALPRDEFSFTSVPNLPQYTGKLAESWEQPDATTIVLHIRGGVKWQDRPPMNGRELVADDVVFNFSRNLGLGEFAADGPSPVISILGSVPIESITATDSHTVVFTLKQPMLAALYHIIGDIYGNQYPPEVIRQDGDAKDWTKLVATGPFMWTGWVEGSSLTYTKNPDYWGHDEKFPENRLPYVDELKLLIMPEEATRLAALRSGQLDFLGAFAPYAIGAATTIENLERTNPELNLFRYFNRGDNSSAFNITEPPFDDIRVRRAMQMAIDLETVADTYFKGYADPTPRAEVGTSFVGYAIPFAEWPEEVKNGYSYDPEGAEKLLDEAGYLRGADGVRFETVLNDATWRDLGYQEIAIQYWDEIGVDVELNLVGAELGPMMQGVTYEGMVLYPTGKSSPLPVTAVGWHASDSSYNNITGHNSAEYDAIIAAMDSAKTIEEQRLLIRDADFYLIENHLFLWGPIASQSAVAQPWILGYNGETRIGDVDSFVIFARLWIDQEMKASMGN